MLSAAIKVRNESLDVPYTYLDPTEVENSVAIWLSDGVSSSARKSEKLQVIYWNHYCQEATAGNIDMLILDLKVQFVKFMSI